MRSWKTFLLLFGAALIAIGLYAARLIWRGFSTADEPSYLEKAVARAARNFAIPRSARRETNPWSATPDLLDDARESFLDRCATCHGQDGSGQTRVGRSLYPKVPDLRLPRTQNLTDGEIRYIIRNGVRMTGMPDWANPHDEQSDDSWKLVLFMRSLRQQTREEQAQHKLSLQVPLTTSARNRARSVMPKSTNAGEKRRWQMSFAILANFLTPSFPIFLQTPFPDSPGIKSPWFTGAFGSNVTSRKRETTIFRKQPSG